MAERPRLFRVHWVPGTDQLSGTCHCGARYTASDPIELWEWLHGHPVGHDGSGSGSGTPAPHESHPEVPKALARA